MMIAVFIEKSISPGLPSDISFMIVVRLLLPGDKSENKEKKTPITSKSARNRSIFLSFQ
jgi:hypothetical protein